MLQETTYRWLIENLGEWANTYRDMPLPNDHPRKAYIDADGINQIYFIDWNSKKQCAFPNYSEREYPLDSVAYIDPLPSSGEGVSAAPAPSDDTPAQSLEDVAGDLLAAQPVAAGRQTSDYPDHECQSDRAGYCIHCGEPIGFEIEWDDDIQASIPQEIEDLMWDTARFLQESMINDPQWDESQPVDTQKQIEAETAEILRMFDGTEEASHEGGEWSPEFDFDPVAALKNALNKANAANQQLRTNEKILLAVIDKQSAQIDRMRGGGNCVLTKKGRALLAKMSNEAVA